MKFRRSICKAIRSPKVKVIEIDPTRPVAIAGLFTGDLQVWDTDKTLLLNTIHVSDEPIRACHVLHKMDWVIVGSDDGNISIYELSNYRKIKTLKAHSDFIRKIESSPQAPSFLTASDDGTIKMWTYENDICQSMVFTGHNHFVMDICFYPADSRRFISCSLDLTIKLWSVGQSHCIKTFKGHTAGVNALCFLGDPQYFITGADDLSIRVWDFQSTQCVATLTKHTNNVSRVHALRNFPLFASGSEDGTVRIWNSKTFKQEDVIAVDSGRVWDIREKDSKLIIGTDEELIFINIQQASSLVTMSRNRIFYSISDIVYGAKTENPGASKELASLGYYPTEMVASPSGKVLAVGYENEFRIYSSLGFRNKFSGEGRDVHFISEEEYVVRNNEKILFYKRSEIDRSISLQGMTRLFYLDPMLMAVNISDEGDGKTRVITMAGQVLLGFDFCAEKVFVEGEYLITCGSTLDIYRISRDVISAYVEQGLEIPEEGISEAFSLLSSHLYTVSSYAVRDNVVYFTSGNKAYYVVLAERPYVYSFSAFTGAIAGVGEDSIFYLHGKYIESKRVDVAFLDLQKAVLLGQKYRVTEEIRTKAISFFESLGIHDEALDLCRDSNQKFEILLRLGRYSEAMENANSVIKYDKLGKAFLKDKNLSKASECYLKARNWPSLFFTDMLSEKKYLKLIGEECMRDGRLNFAFFSLLKAGDVEACARLLKNTLFYNLFAKTYLKNK
jgi:coatomer subunit beta'